MAKVSPIPSGMHTVTPNLVFKDSAAAIEFYKKAFGAEEISRMMAPDGRGVWHASIRIGDSMIFMNDEMPQSSCKAPSPQNIATASIQLYVTDVDAAYKKATDAGVKVLMPLADMFWGDRMGMIVDPFGVTWAIAARVKEMTHDELREAGEEFTKQQQQKH